MDSPVGEGVVLIGDAAGRNDPIIGQGLSITHRDVRLVRDALLGERNWRPAVFSDYVAERRERMSRLRTCARMTALRSSEFGPDADRRRAEIRQRITADGSLGMPFAAAFLGPESLPAEVFETPFVERVMGGPIWN